MNKRLKWSKLFRATFALPVAGQILIATATNAHAQTQPADGQLVQFNDNGAWSWFQDERAIIDTQTNQLLISSIASGDGPGGAARDGQVDVVAYNLNTGSLSRSVMVDYSFLADDHNMAALMVRPDGRYLAVYTAHQNDNLVRWRITTNPGDATSWQPEQTMAMTTDRGTTYSNVFHLSSTNQTYNFVRANRYDPHALVSANDGTTWAYSGHLLMDPANSTGQRPYLKYASNGVDKIYFTTTEAHPRDLNTGIYAGYMNASGQLFKIDGTQVGSLGTNAGTAVSASAFTPILTPSQVVNGTPRTRAWTTDLALDSQGHPYTVFTSRVNTSDTDHRFYYARWNGNAFVMNEIARAGGYLYQAENDYTGLAALNPGDPDTLYISTKIDPRDGTTTTSKYEIYRGFTTDTGASWAWVPITTGSNVDNLRPIMPKWDDTHSALIWFRGTYTTYQRWNAAVVGKFYTGNNGRWTEPAGGNWNQPSSWNDQRIGDGLSFIADFSRLNYSGDVTITDDAPARTIGYLTLGDTNSSSPSHLTLSGTGPLTLDGGVATPIISVQNQTATIARELSGTQGFTKTGSGTLVLGAANSYTGATSVTFGALLIANPAAVNGALSVSGVATARLAPALPSAAKIAGLNLSSIAKFDITDNKLIIDYASGGTSPLNSIVSEIAFGRLISSTATIGTAIGYAEASALFPTGGDFGGVVVDSDMVLLMSTWQGDANLDGQVDNKDLAAIAANWQQPGIWTDGDFNGDGTTDIDDLYLLAANWPTDKPAPALADSLAAAGLPVISVPEPTGVSLVTLGFYTLLCRRMAAR